MTSQSPIHICKMGIHQKQQINDTHNAFSGARHCTGKQEVVSNRPVTSHRGGPSSRQAAETRSVASRVRSDTSAQHSHGVDGRLPASSPNQCAAVKPHLFWGPAVSEFPVPSTRCLSWSLKRKENRMCEHNDRPVKEARRSRRTTGLLCSTAFCSALTGGHQPSTGMSTYDSRARMPLPVYVSELLAAGRFFTSC